MGINGVPFAAGAWPEGTWADFLAGKLGQDVPVSLTS